MCDMIGYLNFSLANHNSYKCFDVTVFIIFIIDVLAMQFRNNRIEFENPNSIGIYDLIAKMTQHVDFDAIEKYLREKTFPCEVGDKGKKSNFRKACKEFSIVDGQLMYKDSRVVISSKKAQQAIIHDIHVGLGEDSKAKAMSAHRGRDSTHQKIVIYFSINKNAKKAKVKNHKKGSTYFLEGVLIN